MTRQLQLPIEASIVCELCAGDEVELSGTVLTGRDRTCKRLSELIESQQPLPVPLKNQLLYFVGPTPAPPGHAIGSAGPTTTGRMEPFLPALLNCGLKGIIGKGYLSADSKQVLRQHQAIYFGAIGGTGALLSQSIVRVEPIAFEDLLSEALTQITFEKFPVVVLNDVKGGDLYAKATSVF